MSKWLCDFCKEEFDSELEAVEHEKTCSNDIALAKEEEKKTTQKRELKEKREKEQKLAKKREKERLARYEEREKQREKLIEEQRKKEKEYQELLEKNKLENPHLALISDHLWWLALMAKIALVMIVLQFFFLFLLLAGASGW